MSEAIKLKIQLLGIAPEIWRRITVPSSLTLTELHAVIQAAMGWRDCHLHIFEIEGRRFEIPEDDRRGPQEGYADERRYTLGMLLSKGMQFTYIYDFGDNWEHRIVVEDVSPAAVGGWLPHCVAGQRACPPEDSGGSDSYSDFLDALASPDHPEHDDMVDWACGFEPEAFNAVQANALIACIRELYREQGRGFRQ